LIQITYELKFFIERDFIAKGFSRFRALVCFIFGES
jgi:hypothetical protein